MTFVQHNSLGQRIADIGKSLRFVAATRSCAIVVAVLQLLLAGLHAWIILDLQIFGTALAPLALSIAATFLVIQLMVIFFAWTLQCNAHAIWFLAAAYIAGLAILGLIVGLYEFDLMPRTVQPGAMLPPNEIMGRGWPLAVAEISFEFAQLLGILPLLLILVVLFARYRHRASAKPEGLLNP